MPQFTKNFAKRIVKPLEKNCLNVCDPQVDQKVSTYQKMSYKMAIEVQTLQESNRDINVDGKWKSVLEKITLGNIHMKNDQ